MCFLRKLVFSCENWFTYVSLDEKLVRKFLYVCELGREVGWLSPSTHWSADRLGLADNAPRPNRPRPGVLSVHCLA